MTTQENAWAAFAGESQANRKYASYSTKAKDEGYPVVAKLFTAASKAEEIHARRLLGALKAIGSTEENLADAVQGETHEYTEMYPAFIELATTEKATEAKTVFTHAMKAEEVHAGLYAKALAAVKSGSDLPATLVYICPVCGNIELGEVPERCGICGIPGSKFELIE
ncbi:MAG: rubrerythrin family protein [Methanomicrobiales archaeon]|jgi:rubrerythrin|nr:rubrerythrin family protein [Methanomicrobiales archaeon]